jgi:hypothetical protein
MYCPKCGSANQDDLKFCTRCGTNLGIVSDALGGKFDNQTEMDERLVSLLKNYYRGRRLTIAGFVLSALMIFKLALSVFWGLGEGLFLLAGILGIFLILGMVWLIWGATKWNNSSSELKALGYDNPKSAAPSVKKAVSQLPLASTVLSVKSYNTDSIKAPAERSDERPAPASVTEQTTRHLEEESAKLRLSDKLSN